MPGRLDVPPSYFLAWGLLMPLVNLGLPGPQLVHRPWRWLESGGRDKRAA
jgi:hypothetical protein